MIQSDFDVNTKLSFVMYACSKEIIKRYKPHLEKYDLTYTQYLTLLVLWENDHLHMNELGKKLYLDSGTLTPIVNRLEKKGLIAKVKSTEDKRSIFIDVTPAGLELSKSLKDLSSTVLKESGFDYGDDAHPVLEQLNAIL
ncbi:MAG: MarR family transcriptional regulator, partial [Erysipelotrichales bacterium]